MNLSHKRTLTTEYSSEIYLFGKYVIFDVSQRLHTLKLVLSAQCNGERCQVCEYVEDTCEFEDADGNKYNISKGIMNCNTDFTVYKFHNL